MKRRITFLVTLVLLTTASLLNAAGVVLTKKTPSQAEEYWSPVEFGSVENFPTSVVITSQETKQTTTIPRHQIGVVIEFLDFNSISILNEDGINKVKAERDSVARHAGQCKPAAGILSVVVRNYDQVLGYYAEGNVLIAGKWLKKNDYEAKQKADALAATAGAIPEVVSGGKSFKNVRVTKVVGNKISIMHEGGIASINSGELGEELRMKLEIAFPKQFEKTSREPQPERSSTSPSAEIFTPKMPIKESAPNSSGVNLQGPALPNVFPTIQACKAIGQEHPELAASYKGQMNVLGFPTSLQSAEYAVGKIALERDAVRKEEAAMIWKNVVNPLEVENIKQLLAEQNKQTLQWCVNYFIETGMTPYTASLYGVAGVIKQSDAPDEVKQELYQKVGKELDDYHDAALREADPSFWSALGRNRKKRR